MTAHRKPTRTDDNKPSRSTPIRKWSIPESEIKKIAKELTKAPDVIQEVQAPAIEPEAKEIDSCLWFTTWKVDKNLSYTLTTTGWAIKTYKSIIEKKAPKIELVEHWNYEIYSEYVKAHCKIHDTYETTANELSKLFPQNKSVYDIVRNLKRSHNISWRRVENWDNDTYILFVEPSKEELTVMLTSAESKVINSELEKHNLQSDLYNTQYQRNRLFFLVILLIIIITLTNYYG